MSRKVKSSQKATKPRSAGAGHPPSGTGRHTAPGRSPTPPQRREPLLSACLIVKDEEAMLPDCLESLHRLVDEVVVYDTGSTDGTVELARRAGARVFEGYWDDDFSRARNAALEHCRAEWILWVDADERFVCPDVRDFRRLLEDQTDFDAVAVEIQNLVDGDNRQSATVHRAFRLFRRSQCCWFGSLHEQVNLRSAKPHELRGVPLKGAWIDHLGYAEEFMKERDKYARNLRLALAALDKPLELEDQAGVPEMNVARAFASMGRYEEGQHYFDQAVEKASTDVVKRMTLLFSAQNLVALGRYEEGAALAATLRVLCAQPGLAYYLEGVCLRHLGRKQEAVQLFRMVEDMRSDDGFVFPESSLLAELASALTETGRLVEASDVLLQLIEQHPEVGNLTSAMKIFEHTGRSFTDLVNVMPERRLDNFAAALTLVPANWADSLAEAAWQRFGPRPSLLAAAIAFSQRLPVSRALEWSIRLRSIGMAGSCPLLAQARMSVLDPAERVRAAVTAHAAFGDEEALEFAVALMAGVPDDRLSAVLAEVSTLDPALLSMLARGALSLNAGHPTGVSGGETRSRALDEALAGLARRVA